MRLALLALMATASCSPSVPESEPSDSDTETASNTDTETDTATDTATDTDTGDPLPVIRGAFESAGPVRSCGGLANWTAPDGLLLRLTMDLCGDDIDALADTVTKNLDAVHARGGRVMLALGQGINLPDTWMDECGSWTLRDGRFEGELCHPWDERYQARLASALTKVADAVRGHPALAGVYFTISSMTNGYELHLRLDRSTVEEDPGDAVIRKAYLDVMDLYQTRFDVPVVFEAGHCLWNERGDSHEECDTPLALYRHSRDTYGVDKSGVAMWNCAERFWATPTSIGAGVRPLLEEVTADGASMGCQTVGDFTSGWCRFTDDEVADYGEIVGSGNNDCVPSDDAAAHAAAACADTMGWFVGDAARADEGVALKGTWGELWAKDWRPGGVIEDDATCAQAVDKLSP